MMRGKDIQFIDTGTTKFFKHQIFLTVHKYGNVFLIAP